MSNWMRAGCAVLMLLLARAAGAEAIAFAQEPSANEKKEKVDAEPGKGLSLKDYDVLIKRNIFSHEQPRSRSGYRVRAKDSTSDGEGFVGPPVQFVGPPAPDAAGVGSAESDIVLIGVVVRDGVGNAWFEDRRASKLLMLKSGDSLAHGKVGTITVNGIEYVNRDKTLTVNLGSNLEGGTSSAKPVDNAKPVDASGNAVDAGTLDLLEKMKRKRQKELGL